MEFNLTKNNHFSFDQISINQREEFEIEISEDIVAKFAEISGDFNPLHMDDSFASNTPFGKRVVHGMLLGSFLSKLIGKKIPGENGVYFSQTMNFRKPCFIGDVLKVVGTIIDKSNSTKIIVLKTEIFNQNKDCILDGEAKVLFY